MNLHQTALNLSLLACLLASAGACLAQQRELKEHKPPQPTVLSVMPAASGIRAHTPQAGSADCKPPPNAAECRDKIDKAHDLLEQIGRDCEPCAPVANPGSQPQTSIGKGVRLRAELPHFCKGVIEIGKRRGYLVTCKKR